MRYVILVCALLSLPTYAAGLDQDLMRYYNKFPVVLSLIEGLEQVSWRVVAQRHKFETHTKRDRLRYLSAITFYDPNSVVKVKFMRGCRDKPRHCYTSANDALVHEMIHAYRQLVSRDAIGNDSLREEAIVIGLENKVFQSMTAIDGKVRPRRSGHYGEIIPF